MDFTESRTLTDAMYGDSLTKVTFLWVDQSDVTTIYTLILSVNKMYHQTRLILRR